MKGLMHVVDKISEQPAVTTDMDNRLYELLSLCSRFCSNTVNEIEINICIHIHIHIRMIYIHIYV